MESLASLLIAPSWMLFDELDSSTHSAFEYYPPGHRALDGAAPTVRQVVEVRLPARAMGALPHLIGPLRGMTAPTP